MSLLIYLGGIYAKEIETPLYDLEFDYVITRKETTPGGTTTNVESGTGYGVMIATGPETSTTGKIQIYGKSANGRSYLEKDGFMTSRTINICVASNLTYQVVEVLDYSGNVIASGNKNVTLENIADGRYEIRVDFGTCTYDTSARSGVSIETKGSSYFVVDTTAPTINGASESISGKFVNGPFTLQLVDNISGFDYVLVKRPGENDYTLCEYDEITISPAKDGMYEFISYDKCGNSSSPHYVFVDTKKPSLVFCNLNGNILEGKYTKDSFKIVSSDIGSGAAYVEYKKPSSASFERLGDDGVIDKDSTKGKYIFRCLDKAGNISDEYEMILDTQKPYLNMYSETDILLNNGVANGNYLRFVASDRVSGLYGIFVKTPGQSSFGSYSSGCTFSKNGVYQVYALDNAGNMTNTYTVTLDNEPPVIYCTQTDLYSTYEYDFTINAQDSYGKTKLYYKGPDDEEYILSENDYYVVNTTNSDGRYYFYAQDAAGNESDVVWIELKVKEPSANIFYDETKNAYYADWDGSFTATVNGRNYVKNSLVFEEGNYTLIITNNSGRQKTYEFSIDHVYYVKEEHEATCTSDGTRKYVCISCGDSYIQTYENALGHDYEEELICENCNEGAYYKYTCERCGDSYTSEPFSLGGHRLSKTVVEPTCIERGYTIYECTICGYSTRDNYTLPQGHDIISITYEPTCENDGYTHYECTKCGFYSDEDIVSKTGHDFEMTKKEVTCNSDGYDLYVCTRCGYEYKENVVEATGHVFEETTIDVTCESDGKTIHRCKICGYEYETDLVKSEGHKYLTEVASEPTCTGSGLRRYICSVCGLNYEKEISPKGHAYTLADEKIENEETIRTYICDVCGDIFVQNLGNQYEEVSSFIESMYNYYSPYMVYIFLSTSGIWSIILGVGYTIARRNEDKEKSKRMIINYFIGLIVIFVILIAAPLLVKEIVMIIK